MGELKKNPEIKINKCRPFSVPQCIKHSRIISFKINNLIQGKKLVLEEQNNGWFLNPIEQWYETPRSSNSCRKSRARTVEKILRAWNALETKLENFGQNTNKLKESPCVFFVTILLKKWNNTSSIGFSIGLVFSNFS